MNVKSLFRNITALLIVLLTVGCVTTTPVGIPAEAIDPMRINMVEAEDSAEMAYSDDEEHADEDHADEEHADNHDDDHADEDHDDEMAEAEAEPVAEPVVEATTEDEATVADEAVEDSMAETVVDDRLANRVISVGSRDFTEQYLMGHITMQLLESAGFEVIDNTGLGGTKTSLDAMQNGEVDVIWEYTGTALAAFHNMPSAGLPSNPQVAYEMAAALDKNHNDFIWLAPTLFNDTYTMMVNTENEALADLKSMEDLAAYMNENGSPLTFCVENDFYSRNDGFFPLLEHYGFSVSENNINLVAYDSLYSELRDGGCDVAEGFSTDGRIAVWGLRNLADSLEFFPAYNMSAVVRGEVLEMYPEIGEILSAAAPLLTDEVITAMNGRVDLGADAISGSGDEETLAEVAASFIAENRLTEQRSKIVVGSRDFTEQFVLAHITMRWLEANGYAIIDETGLGGTQTAIAALLADEIDVYWEYTGTALAAFHEIPSSGLPTDPELAWETVKALDELHNNLIWQEPALFNDTYTLMINPNLLDVELGSIEDLADFMNANGSPLRLCVENDFFSRPDGLFPMLDHYGFTFKEENIELVAYDSLYTELRDGGCDVAEGFSTDGRISAWGLQNLADNKLFFPAYNAAPIVRQEVLDENPNMSAILNELGVHIDDAMMTRLNARVDVGLDGIADSGDESSLTEIADLFLCGVGLVDCSEAEAAQLYEEFATLTTGSAESIVAAPSCENSLANGDFEANSGWLLEPTNAIAQLSAAEFNSGAQALEMIAQSTESAASWVFVSQLVAIPEDVASVALSFSYLPVSADMGDALRVMIMDTDGETTLESFNLPADVEGWTAQTLDLSAYAGQEVMLRFAVQNTVGVVASSMFVDDAAVTVCAE